MEAGAAALQAIIDATDDANGDDQIQASELKKALKGKSKAEGSAALGTHASVVGYVHADPSRAELTKYLKNFLTAVKAADADGDGTLSLTELRTLKNRGQERLVELAKANAGSALEGTALEFHLNQAGKDASWVSESDSTPTFLSTADAFTGPITGDKVMAAFNDEIENPSGDELTFEKKNVAEFWKDVTTPKDPNAFSSASSSDGWKTLQTAIAQTLSDVALFRVGPKATDGSLATDQGSYTYFLVGKTTDAKLAGVKFESVET